MLLNEALMASSRGRNSNEKQLGVLVSNKTRRGPKEKPKPLQLLNTE
jgi:hypothetical protein